MFDIKKAAAEMAANMTLTEKVSQMMHSAAAVDRLKIPAYNWWNEALHGVARAGTATVFPQAIALAATFDADLLRRVGDVVSTEGRAKFHAQEAEGDRDIYKGLTFWAPNINIFRDPRWGRGHETYGEDPYLTSRLGVAYIRGLQGTAPGGSRDCLKAAACAKHFAVHSGPENERHKFNALCDDYDLWNTYLAAFEAAVTEGGVEIVMGAYNRTLGEPCCGSKRLLTDILRDKWHFDGHVVSDCWAIKDFHEAHRVTESPLESVALAVNSGCDLNCGILFGLAAPAVEQGLISEERVTEAVTRLLTTRMRLGLLGAPESPYALIPYGEVDSPSHVSFNLETARKTLVLLKNDGSLPLRSPAAGTGVPVKTLGVIGPNADSRLALEGNYQGTPRSHDTVLEALNRLGEAQNFRVLYSEGCPLVKSSVGGLGQKDDRFAEARIVTKNSDAVVVVLGLDSAIEGEEGDAYSDSIGGDKPNLKLPGRQEALLSTVIAAAGKKPVILVNISGSSIALGDAGEKVNALLQAFYPGSQGGTAIAEALFGVFSPSGKLPVTFYASDDDLPPFTDYAMTGRTYRYFNGTPLYPFGYGKTYTTFKITKADYKAASGGGGAPQVSAGEVTVAFTNCGAVDSGETLQVYVESSGTKEKWQLAAVRPVFAKAGASSTASLAVSSAAFTRYDPQGDRRPVPGPHILHVGFTQPDPRSVSLYGEAPLRIPVK